MDFDPTDEQRMLAETVNSLLDKRYDPNSPAEAARQRARLEPRAVAAVRRARPARADLRRAVRRRRDGRGRARHRDGVVRPVAGARAVLRDRGARRRRWCRGRHAGAEGGDPAQGGGGRAAARVRATPSRAPAGRRPTSPTTAQPRTRRRVDGLRREDRGARRRQRRHADRQRASRPTAIGLFLVDAADVTVDAVRHAGRPARRGRAAGRRARGSCSAPRPTRIEHISSRDRRRDGGAVRRGDRRCERMLWMTVDYLKTRVQFGRPIAVFQALQFRAADMYVALEQARSMALLARLSLDGRRRRGAAADGARGQDPGRPVQPADRAGVHPAARRHRDDDGVSGRALLQAHAPSSRKTFADTSELIELVGADGGLIG